MSIRQLKTKILHKYKSESFWDSLEDFTPEKGELLVYSADEEHEAPRIKFGDGKHNPVDLPFIGVNTSKVQPLLMPVQSVSLTYNGASQRPTWENYDPDKMVIGRATRGIDAGVYIAEFTLLPGYCWEDGTKTPIRVEWIIEKAIPELTASQTSIEFNVLQKTTEINITTNSPGATYVISGNTDVVTANIIDKTIIATYAGIGETVITVNIQETSNHSGAIINIPVKAKPIDLESCTWEEISAIAKAGCAESYFNIGDAKTINLNGKVGNYATFDNQEYKVFIIGFNHNQGLEGVGISFCGFKDADGTQVCLCDSLYGDKNTKLSDYCFRLTYNDSTSGWENSQMRKHILGNVLNNDSLSLLNALPNELKTVLKPMIKFTVNSGTSTSPVAASTTVDYISLLSEYEVLGEITTAALEKEKEAIIYQKQYEYFNKGNSQVFYNNNTAEESQWWLRTVAVSYRGCSIGSTYGYTLAYNSLGIVPIFKV